MFKQSRVKIEELVDECQPSTHFRKAEHHVNCAVKRTGNDTPVQRICCQPSHHSVFTCSLGAAGCIPLKLEGLSLQTRLHIIHVDSPRS